MTENDGKLIRNPVLVDLLRGGVFTVNDAVRTEQGCTAFKNLPLTDYPLVITDRSALRERFAGCLELASGIAKGTR